MIHDLHSALIAGLNLEKLLRELQMDAETFALHKEFDRFTPSERKIINRIIND